ncbi:MAG TPA: hypothetical protein QGF58_07960 [Myxococcota bacterium]|nr:hypothetical protein [Myxococcota bacterium]
MTQKTAQQEAWWADFVSEFGKTPLRELARRFETNPRRLRRAAQRSGLSDEPDAIRDNAALLGMTPDASVATKLGVTAEEVKGARARRGIAAYNKAAPPPKTQPPAPKRAAPKRAAPKRAAPKRATTRSEPTRSQDAEPDVVVKRGASLSRRSESSMPGQNRLGRLGRIAPIEPEVTRRPPRRRRIVKKD